MPYHLATRLCVVEMSLRFELRIRALQALALPLGYDINSMEGEEGFEPSWESPPLTVFKTAAFNQTLPLSRFPLSLEEEAGFEPAKEIHPLSSFPSYRNQPLCHSSLLAA